MYILSEYNQVPIQRHEKLRIVCEPLRKCFQFTRRLFGLTYRVVAFQMILNYFIREKIGRDDCLFEYNVE